MKTNQNNKKTVPTQEQIEVVCRQRARHFWNWLTWSLVYYVVINLFLIAINWFTSPHYFLPPQYRRLCEAVPLLFR